MINKPRRIGPDDTIPLRLSEQERKLILDEVFDPEDLFKGLRLGTVEGDRLVYRFTYDDVDLLSELLLLQPIMRTIESCKTG